jgi:MFS family permease
VNWFRDAFGHADIRALAAGSFLSVFASFALAVAVAVYAYGEGGAGLVAYYGVASVVPGAVLTPILMSVTSRGRADRVLRRTTVVRVVLVVGAVVGALADAAPVLVVTLAAIAVSLGATYRPTQAVLLPWLARTPRELTAANVAATITENAGALAGPALAGVLLAWTDPVVTIATSALLMALTAAALLRVAAPHRMDVSPRTTRHGLVREAVRGAGALSRLAPPAGVVVLVFGQTFVRGALGVLLVLFALETLDLGDGGVGWLTAAIGLGGLAGAGLAARVVRLDRLARCFAAGILFWAVGTAALGAAPGLAVAVIALVVVGTGNALEDAGLFVLVPRRLGPRDAGAGLGAVELVVVAGSGSGALVAPVLAHLLGVRGGLLVVGATLGALVLAYLGPVRAVDRSEPPPSPDVELLRGLPAFSALPIVVVEDLATALEDEVHAAGTTVFAEGDLGDRFEVVRAGSAAVHVRGVQRRVLGPGDGFGEIALVRDVPRTATVTAITDLSTASLDRSRFLGALATTPASRGRVEDDVSGKLAGDPDPQG